MNLKNTQKCRKFSPNNKVLLKSFERMGQRMRKTNYSQRQRTTMEKAQKCKKHCAAMFFEAGLYPLAQKCYFSLHILTQSPGIS